jgi:hypothetical protein
MEKGSAGKNDTRDCKFEGSMAAKARKEQKGLTHWVSLTLAEFNFFSH